MNFETPSVSGESVEKSDQSSERKQLAEVYRDLSERTPEDPPTQGELLEFSDRVFAMDFSDQITLMLGDSGDPKRFLDLLESANEGIAAYEGEDDFSVEEAEEFKAELLQEIDEKLDELIPPESNDAVEVVHIESESGFSARWATDQLEVTRSLVEGRLSISFAGEIRSADLRIVYFSDSHSGERIMLIQEKGEENYDYGENCYMEVVRKSGEKSWVVVSDKEGGVFFGSEGGEEPAKTRVERAQDTVESVSSIEPPTYSREAHLAYIRENYAGLAAALVRGPEASIR